MNYQEIRKKYPLFRFDDFSWQKKSSSFEIEFLFSCGDFKFKSPLSLQFDNLQISPEISNNLINNFVFNLGMIEMLNYWKAFCSPKIEVRCGKLSKPQINFWQKLIINGFGQYFYENKIDFTQKDFISIESHGQKFSKEKISLDERYLLGLGGGKDSSVCIKILEKAKADFNYFSINPIEATIKASKINPREHIIIKRHFDPQLFQLNQEGFLNGHVPFSAFVAIAGSFCAALTKHKYFVVGNENDSNEGNLKWKNKVINHQYSKTIEFESDFRKYLNSYIISDSKYYSLIRPFSELKVAELFSRQREFWPIFLSCNVAQRASSKEKTWCNNCSKCLFTYLILAPFIDQNDLIGIFGKNLLNDEKLLPILEDLVLPNKIKPFECVGMRQTSQAALFLGIEKYQQEKIELPFLLSYAKKNLLKDFSKAKAKKILATFGKNFLDTKMKNIAKAIV